MRILTSFTSYTWSILSIKRKVTFLEICKFLYKFDQFTNMLNKLNSFYFKI